MTFISWTSVRRCTCISWTSVGRCILFSEYLYTYTYWYAFVYRHISISIVRNIDIYMTCIKDDIRNIWNFIACFESFHGCWYALISLKVSEKNRRGAMQKSRGQQAMETTRIIPMLFQKGIQRQYVGGEGERRYDAKFSGIEQKWESNTGCLKWRREPCAKRNTAVAPTGGVFHCNEHHRNTTELSEPLVGEDMGKGNCECSLYYHRKPCFFLVACDHEQGFLFARLFDFGPMFFCYSTQTLGGWSLLVW